MAHALRDAEALLIKRLSAVSLAGLRREFETGCPAVPSGGSHQYLFSPDNRLNWAVPTDSVAAARTQKRPSICNCSAPERGRRFRWGSSSPTG